MIAYSNDNDKIVNKESNLEIIINQTNIGDNCQLIPLKIPYYSDPRRMNKYQLVRELRSKNLNSNGQKSILVARLLNSIVVEGLRNIPNPMLMDDRQPEKWMLIANQSFQVACDLESNPDEREKCMGSANLRLGELTKSREGLIAIATGTDTFDHEGQSELYNHLIRFGAALMLEPIVEKEAEIITTTCTSSDIISSVSIFNMCTGFQGIPDFLTEEVANEHLKVSDENSTKRKYNVVINNVDVEINGEIFIDMNGFQMKSRVAKISSEYDENGNLTHDIIVKPVNVFDGGKLSRFQLSLEEYQISKSNSLLLNNDDRE